MKEDEGVPSTSKTNEEDSTNELFLKMQRNILENAQTFKNGMQLY